MKLRGLKIDKEAQVTMERDLEIEAVYDISEDLLRLPFFQSKQGLCWRVAEHLYKLGYHKPPKDKPSSHSGGLGEGSFHLDKMTKHNI